MVTKKSPARGQDGMRDGSEPTVWDGDHININLCIIQCIVLSPPCGMVTDTCIWQEQLRFYRSEPTVWDGDVHGRKFQITQCISSEPTVWDGDVHGRKFQITQCISSEPTVWDRDE